VSTARYSKIHPDSFVFLPAMNITEILLSWYGQNKRDLPWRETPDPYKIWLSEVILQQTRVSQGLDYYLHFVERFPDVRSLAAASEDEVLKLWQGLGYYSRARNLHHAAKTIVNEYNGVFPGSYSLLLKLKGIGEYTAAAIASIAFDEAVPVVDGNVARVLSRLFALEEPVDTPAGRRLLRQLAEDLISRDAPATFNQAIMEFGALHCTPSSPGCSDCPLRMHCEAYQKGKTEDFPRKLLKTKVKVVYFQYMVVTFTENGEDYMLLRKREQHGIWKNLFDFPSMESDHEPDVSELIRSEVFRSLTQGNDPGPITPSKLYKHQLTHRCIYARFFRIRLEHPPGNTCSYIPVRWPELNGYPVPRLIEKYLEEFFAV